LLHCETPLLQVLLLLLCAGIQDKNSDIADAAMRVDLSLHCDIIELIRAVIRPDEPTMSLPSNFARVLFDRTGLEKFCFSFFFFFFLSYFIDILIVNYLIYAIFYVAVLLHGERV
jgi:hypothetical protein